MTGWCEFLICNAHDSLNFWPYTNSKIKLGDYSYSEQFCLFLVTFLRCFSARRFLLISGLDLWMAQQSVPFSSPFIHPFSPATFLQFYLPDWHGTFLSSQRFQRLYPPGIQNTAASWTFDGGKKKKEETKKKKRKRRSTSV